jgi:hypothetical protein
VKALATLDSHYLLLDTQFGDAKKAADSDQRLPQVATWLHDCMTAR